MIRIVQSDRNRSITQRLSVLGAGKDNVLHAAASELLYPLLTQHPADGIRDITLPTPVRAYDTCNAVVEVKFYLVRKGFKSLHLYVL